MIRWIFIFIPFAFALTACGVKGSLQPTGKPEPMAVSAIALQQQGDELLLSWQAPIYNQDGSPLQTLSGFRIDRYTYEPTRYCPECRDQETIATIDTVNPAPALIRNATFYYRTGKLDEGLGYRYRVRPLTRSGKVGPTAEIRRTIIQPPAAPIALRAEELDRGIRLFWNLPEGVQQAGELLGVNIYQGNPGTALNPEPVNAEPINGNNFENFGLENGQTYLYGLRTVIRTDNLEVESALGEILVVTPKAGL